MRYRVRRRAHSEKRQCERDAAGAGSPVDEAWLGQCAKVFGGEDEIDELLGFRAWHEGSGICFERKIPKIPLSDDILNRFAGGQPFHSAAHGFEPCFRKRSFAEAHKFGAFAPEEACHEMFCRCLRCIDAVCGKVGGRGVQDPSRCFICGISWLCGHKRM